MARTRNTEVVETVETTEEAVTPKGNKTSVTVVWRAGSRVYSQAVHGDDFEALAAEFAAKKKGTLV